MSKVIHQSGFRKKARARATLKEGTGKVKVNTFPLETIKSDMVRLKIQEPLLLAEEDVKKIDISVTTSGGGVISQAEAARLAIAKALVAFNAKFKKPFLDYDRTLLVADVRQRESRKPNTQGKARSKRQKSYR